MLCARSHKAQVHRLICPAIDEFESSEACVVHISLWLWGCPAGRGQHLHCPAGFCHQHSSPGRSSLPCSLLLWLSLSSSPSRKPGVQQPPVHSPLHTQWGPWQSWWLQLALAFLLAFLPYWWSNCRTLEPCAWIAEEARAMASLNLSWYLLLMSREPVFKKFIFKIYMLILANTVTWDTRCYTAQNANFIFQLKPTTYGHFPSYWV